MRAFHVRLAAVLHTAPVGVSALAAVANTAAVDHRSRAVTVATSGHAFGATALVAAYRAALATLSTEVLVVNAAVVPQPHTDSGSDPASESSDDDALPVAAVAAAAREEGTGSRRFFLSAEALRASALSAFDGNADTAEGVAAAMRAALGEASDSGSPPAPRCSTCCRGARTSRAARSVRATCVSRLGPYF